MALRLYHLFRSQNHLRKHKIRRKFGTHHQNRNSLGARGDTKLYGLRKNGVDIAKPEYEQEELFVIDDLSCIIFMNRETQKAHLYSTETGKEIYTYCYKQENQYERFHRFRFEKLQQRIKMTGSWQSMFTAIDMLSDPRLKSKPYSRQKNGKIYQLKTKIITYEEELYPQ